MYEEWKFDKSRTFDKFSRNKGGNPEKSIRKTDLATTKWCEIGQGMSEIFTR